MRKFPKDRWIMDAIRRRYIIPREDGTILRCKKADPDGGLLSDEYHLVTQQVHKKSGRVFFNMTWRGFTKSVLVNRVIALAFLPNPKNLPQVNHVDGDKEHNYLRQPTAELRAKWGEYQLEWASGSDNEKHAHRTGLKSGRGSANSNAKLTAEQVNSIRERHRFGEEVANLASAFDVSRSTVVNILNNRTWTHV